MGQDPRSVSKLADLPPPYVEWFWRAVKRCLCDVFHKSKRNADHAIHEMKEWMERLSDEAKLLTYHDSPLQISASLAGAANRPLTPEEELAWDNIVNSDRADRPSRDDVLRGYEHSPRFS
jgi:hypothetical protein